MFSLGEAIGVKMLFRIHVCVGSWQQQYRQSLASVRLLIHSFIHSFNKHVIRTHWCEREGKLNAGL